MATQPLLTNEDVTRGFDAGEFYCQFQPRLSLASREVLGAEALIRWRHQAFGELPPSVFLPFLINQGRAYELTQFVIDASLAACAA